MTEEGRGKVKEIFLQILQREISRTYRVPHQVSPSHSAPNSPRLLFSLKKAFTAFDPVGKNVVTANDIVNSKMAYRLPFTKEELRFFLENESIFKRIPQLNIDMFIKYLFPENLRGAQNTEVRGASESSSSGNESIDTSTGGSAVRPRQGAAAQQRKLNAS